MAHFTLDDIRAAAAAKYASTDIDFNVDGEDYTLSLINPLSMPKEKRDQMVALQEDKDMDPEAMMPALLCLAASNRSVAEKFVAVVGSDLAVLATVLDNYGKASQVGEA